MPMKVDHEQRRRQIIAGLLTVAANDGLHQVTMRSAAQAAGVSLRLVQYYFGSKAQLLHAALVYLEQQSTERWNERMNTLPPDAGCRARLEAYFDEALPTDDASRAFHIVFSAYTALAMTDPSLARQPFVDGPRRIQQHIAAILTRALQDGQLPPTVDPDTEAARMVAFEHGLGAGILIGQHTSDDAASLVRYHLDRIFDNR
ncbi:TetR/AcrR family transcriptional regulator [Williamsia sp. 1135]|uniref:TetR/AcrR family transcriptional regulator n=1 Tax=Williamsia sp. 1135 TaxID=1889262 RepID=UPI000A1226E1|nr:TetR/AcrR family transcriptional regulator [Williamsia sp. 1135]ORM38078.1 TetR family transcriptional regulator [Williamsia sp. 1135]